jgi:undecaprenyl pyrophosphate phosphatase UppP
MASDRTRAWIERLAWILLYGGLFAVVLGLAALKESAAAAWSLIVVGAAMAIAGIVLIWVRSRLDGG